MSLDLILNLVNFHPVRIVVDKRLEQTSAGAVNNNSYYISVPTSFLGPKEILNEDDTVT